MKRFVLKKSLSLLMRYIVVLLIPAFLTACKEDEPDNPFDQPQISTGDDDSQSDSNAQLEKIIKENVSVKASYSDYTTTFIITSDVKSKLRNNVEYGIGHSTSEFKPETPVSVGSDAYSYSVKSSGNTEIITFKNPFWFYYVCANNDDEKWTDCERMYGTYLELKDKGISHLTSEEKDLYDLVTYHLDKYEREVKSDYRQGVYVLYDDRFYLIGTYTIH